MPSTKHRRRVQAIAAAALCLSMTVVPSRAQAASEPFLAEIMFVPFEFCPKGWARANGQLLPINQNTALFALLGATYGGDGQTTFRLPKIGNQVASRIAPGDGTIIEVPLHACIALQGVFPPRP